LADRVLLTAAGELQAGKGIPLALGGSGQPLSNGVVLDASEVATITARVAAYNAAIASEANAAGAALGDANAILADIAHPGVSYGGIRFDSSFLTGGIFSYDGVHPTRFGYALVALKFIEAINAKFGTHIAPPNLLTAMRGGAGAGNLVSLDLSMLQFAPEFDENLR